ncbi:hypothetical protein RJ53_01610 [Methanocalculus chunghsingensis]|uniref:Squalene cyclase C-terminal domain-containing protein n=1 Tax=Methanocalculus chunghsingensis TaxID=156457 RepID=A0A8J8B4P8_9EURY|nr:prenyltransferase/squalene oxidase repeat-containing protein [Methanocalculus chunghsingensis]MBR1368259.1 hypothetical protein [Methanocalculus chunghsingensis]
MPVDVEEVLTGLLDETKKHLVIQEDQAYFTDPIFDIVRNRVNAEICKTLIRMGDLDHVPGLIRYITDHQNPDGSWNEIHPQYNQPSALITSFIGEALILAYNHVRMDASLKRARGYVLSQERAPGLFLKSAQYTADHLNVDASCGAFLAAYGNLFSDQISLDAAHRAAERICQYQAQDGSYPYTSDKGSYPHALDIPCIHYQGVTMYYLAKINAVLGKDWINDSLMKGADWLASQQRDDGSFDWSSSGLLFAYYLSGAQAFAYASFLHAAEHDSKYLKSAEGSLEELTKNINGIMLRWEGGSWGSLSPLTSLRTSRIGDFPLKEQVFRIGYGMYREIARRRFSYQVDPTVFHILCSLLGIKASTIEASNNYPDLFMTSEVLDCLSYTISHGGNK